MTEPGLHHSAFDPFWSARCSSVRAASDSAADFGEDEVEDRMDPTEGKSTKTSSSSKPSKFFNIRALRRRRIRSGRENPARPPSTSSSSMDGKSPVFQLKSKRGLGLGMKSSSSSDSESYSVDSTSTASKNRALIPENDKDASVKSRMHVVLAPSIDEEADEKLASMTSVQQYHSLGSVDADENEYEPHPQDLEAVTPSRGGTLLSILRRPYPSYQQFVDEADASKGEAQVQPRFILPPKSPQASHPSSSSHGSGSQSRLNTSNLTHGTSTSAMSSEKTVTSSIASADREVREVMEANRFPQSRHGAAGDESIHSASTSSTNIPYHVGLFRASPNLREGASLHTDQFFAGSSLPMAHSSSTSTAVTGAYSSTTGTSGSNSNTSGSAISGYRSGSTRRVVLPPGSAAAAAAHGMNNSPVTVSSSSAAYTTSSSSTGSEQPPQFVSYLDKKTPSEAVIVKTTAFARSPLLPAIAAVDSIDEEDQSRAPASGESNFAREELKQSIKPVKKRGIKMRKWIKVRSRPPRSSVNPTADGVVSNVGATPPPFSVTESPTSSATATPRTPPRRMIESRAQEDLHRMGASRPQVVRSHAGGRGATVHVTSERMVLLPPSADVADISTLMTTIAGTGADEGAQEVFTSLSALGLVSPDADHGGNGVGIDYQGGKQEDVEGAWFAGSEGVAFVTP